MSVPKLNFLFSQAYIYKPTNALRELVLSPFSEVTDVMIDSGAFTNFRSKLRMLSLDQAYSPVVKLEDYIADCHLYKKHVWQYIQLDVIDSAEQTRANLNTMLDAGLTPMPVLLMRDDPKLITSFTPINPWVCIAGGVTESVGWIARRLRDVEAYADQKAMYHCLGVSKYPLCLQTPLHSGDSSTYAVGSRYGSVTMFTPYKGFLKVRLVEMHRRASTDREVLLGYLLKGGINQETIKDETQYAGLHSIPSLTTVYSFLRYHEHLSKLDRRYFFAVSNLSWISIIIAVLYSMTESGWSYKEAISAYTDLYHLQAKKDRQAYIDQVVRILKEKTYGSHSRG